MRCSSRYSAHDVIIFRRYIPLENSIRLNVKRNVENEIEREKEGQKGTREREKEKRGSELFREAQ